MIASILLSLALVLSSASLSVAQTNTYSFCFTSTSLPNSPYGPWSVATGGTITTTGPQFFVNDTSAANGGQRMAYNVTGASVTRVQINRDGSTSTAQLNSLCATGVQGSDNRVFTSAPYFDWNGICFAVSSSTNSPPGTSGWIVYPNDFPTQQVELYYDLPTYTYPTEYHHDNQTNAQLTMVSGSSLSCSPPALPYAAQTSSLSYQFCYQAYAAAQGSVPAWQVAIQGTITTPTSMTTSSISGQTGFYILSVTGTRYQSVGGGATTSVPIVGQTWHNSGGGDANEYSDDPLLLQSRPHLDSYGFVLYTASLFTYPNGSTETVNNYYARVNADPLVVSGNSVREQMTTPDWSQFAVSGSSAATCPLISSSSNAAPDYYIASNGQNFTLYQNSAVSRASAQSALLVGAALLAAVSMLW